MLAKAGIQEQPTVLRLDSRFRGNDTGKRRDTAPSRLSLFQFDNNSQLQ
jgi:hypothetical protein